MTPAEMRFIDDYVREGYTVEPMGTYYTMFGLRTDAMLIEDAGNRAAVRFARDSRGFPDGIELLKLVPKSAPKAATVADYENGCEFCGHNDCPGSCCAKCNDPRCYRTYGVCPTCTAQADKASKDAA